MGLLYLDKKYFKYKNFIYLLFSIFISFKLSALDNILFKDRDNYLLYLNRMDLISERILSKGVLFFEPLFFFLNSVLLRVFYTPENVLLFWIFFVCISFSYFVFRFTKNSVFAVLFLLLLFFQPQTFALMLITTRQGIGVSLLLWSMFFIKKERHFVIILLLAGLIHNTFLLIAFLYFIVYYLNSRGVSPRNRYFIIVLVSLAINYLFLILLNFFNVRLNYADYRPNVGGAGFLMWLSVLIYLSLFKKNLLLSSSLIVRISFNFSIIGLIIYLSSYFFSPIAGRIIGAFIPFIYFTLFYKMRMIDLSLVLLLLAVNIYLFINGGAEAFLETDIKTFFNEIL